MDAVLLVSQAPNGALSARRFSATASVLPSSNFRNPLFAQCRPSFPSRTLEEKSLHLTLVASGDPGPSGRAPAQPFPSQKDDTVFVGEEGVLLEGVIQFEKPLAPPPLLSRAQVALLPGGDVLCLLAFSAIGRFSHGFPVLDIETLKTADPFIAGWLLSAYFLGGFGDDGKGMNGYGKALATATKSWIVGIPLGLAIRAATSSSIPQTTFILAAMGSTGILLVGWRALICKFLARSNRNDVYKRGSPFELFELLTSLVRRW
ncbi:hypothetical protein AXF42_Ash003162 [Apostasia shenzhenica]|uniref:Uncharacterized protein n=1 Tax=Apostasia shenzhenica TaxID=1088818 RepID=A0A2I0BFD3_9ASPA|nr:hypothetical protein AXF42_Ash003162 [Apostasia shenzhenica]